MVHFLPLQQRFVFTGVFIQSPAMSQSYPNRRPSSDSDYRPDQPCYSWSQESLSSSSRISAAGPSSQDGILNLLTSCGLEPKDLAVLARLPEDVLTVESLPGIIQQIKGEEETVKPFPPPSSFHSSHWPPNSFTSRDLDQLRRQPVQYPFQRIPSTAPPNELLQGGHMTIRSVRSPSSSSRAAMDTDHRPRPSQYGKVISSCSRVSLKKEPRPSRFSDAERTEYRGVPPACEFKHCMQPGFARPNAARPNAGRPNAARPNASLPSKEQAQDFHGVFPLVFPYSCSLCDITVLSEKVWTNHINSSVHADGQLRLLQQFPNWDCRVETSSSSRGENRSGRWKDEASPAPSAQRTNQNEAAAFQSSKKLQKMSDRGKVVCVKFPAQTVDETYLRSLIEPFGKMGKILLFPSVAFVELGSSDQAKDLIKFYINSDPAVKKKQIKFSISNTFSFLQSSQVVSFTPSPRGEDGRSDLISIIRRFGELLYTLFLPSKAFIEMKFSADAQKLVDYYYSNTLRINNDSISVSFSSEYKSLVRVSLAQRYEEKSAKTTTNSSESSRYQRSRSRSRTRCSREDQTRSRSRSRSSREQKTRTESGDESCKDLRSSSSSVMQNLLEKNSEEPDMETRSGANPEDVSTNRESDEEQMDSEDGLSAEESDIEGMEVIAEDGENVKDEDEESLEEEEEEEETHSPEEKNKSSEQGEEEVKSMEDEKEEEVKHPEADEEKFVTEEKMKEQEEPADLQEDEEVDFPLDLETCITLDEVDFNDEGGPAASDGSKVFMEMSTPAEIFRPEEELGSKPVLGASSCIRRSEGLHESMTSDLDQISSRSRERNESIETDETPEKVPGLNGDQELRMDPEEELVLRRTPKEESTSVGLKTRTGRREGSPGETPDPLKVQETKPEVGARLNPDHPEEPSSNREHQSAGVCLENQLHTEPPEQIRVLNPSSGFWVKADDQDPETDQQPEPPRPEPAKPVGVEFVRPVVGYFCNLCQLIFSDEDEAKLQHCSTLEHHRKYQEKMGRSFK